MYGNIMIPGWDTIIPGCGGISTLFHGATLENTTVAGPAATAASALLRIAVRWWMKRRGLLPPHRTAVAIG